MRTIKALGTLTAVGLALMAIAGPASANTFNADIAPAGWSGTNIGSKPTLSLGSDGFPCGQSTLSGETTNASNSELTLTPAFGGCTSQGQLAILKMNGCKFRLHPGNGTLVGSMSIVACESPMVAEFGLCSLTVGNQSGLAQITYVNSEESGKKVITAKAELSGITYTRAGSGGCAGPQGTYSNGTFTAEWKIKGFVVGGAPQVNVWNEVPPPPPPTEFLAEEAPLAIAGLDIEEFGKRIFGLKGGSQLSCHTASFVGVSSSVAFKSVTLLPAYKECYLAGKKTSEGDVSMGGCSYVLHVSGKFDITGETCAGNPITLKSPTGCTTTIGPQSGLTGSEVAYVNEGSGKSRTVSSSGTIEKVTYTNSGSCGAGNVGTFNTGKINIKAKLSATNAEGKQQGLSVK